MESVEAVIGREKTVKGKLNELCLLFVDECLVPIYDYVVILTGLGILLFVSSVFLVALIKFVIWFWGVLMKARLY